MSSNRWKFRGLWEVVHHVMHELIINGIIDVRMPHWDPIKAEAGHFGIIRTRSSILRLKPVWIKPSAWLELDFPFELVDPIRKMEFLIEIVVSRSAIWGGAWLSDVLVNNWYFFRLCFVGFDHPVVFSFEGSRWDLCNNKNPNKEYHENDRNRSVQIHLRIDDKCARS